MTGRLAATVLLALLGGAVLPGPLAGQQRVIDRTELERLVPDPTLRRSLLRVGPGTVDTVDAASPTIRLDRSQILVGRTGATPERLPNRLVVRPGDIEWADPERESVQEEPHEVIGVLPSPPLVAADEAMALPFHIVARVADGDNELVPLRVVYQLARPLRYNPPDGAFSGSFLLALQDTTRPQTSRPLSAPVQLQLAGDVDTFAPALLEIRSTNFPLMEVQVQARAPADSVRVRIIPEFDLDGVDL